MKVAVWCPSCRQKYSVSEEHLEKRMRCKKCSHAFLGRDSTSPPVDPLPQVQSTQASPDVEEETFVAEIVPASPAGTDISQYFVGGSFGPATGPANKGMGGYPSTAPTTPAVRHESSPWMIPAILAAVIIPLVLAVVSFFGRAVIAVNDVRAVAQRTVENAEARSNDLIRPNPDAKPVHSDDIDTAPLTGDSGVNRSENSGFTENESGKKSPAEIRAEEIERAKVAKAKADKESRDRERELADKAFEARREKRRIEREKRNLAREEAKRIETEAKEHLAAMEFAASEKPLEGLIARMKVDGWGAKGLAISNEGMLYVATPDTFVVYDSKKEREVSSREKLGGIDRFSAVSLSNDGSLLAVGGDKGGIELYDLSKRGKPKSVQSYQGHNSSITHLAFNSQGTRLMSFDRKYGVCFWDVNEKSCIKKIENFGTKLRTFHVNSERNSITLAGLKEWSEYGFVDGGVLKTGEFPFYMAQNATYSGDGTRMLGSAGGGLKAHKLDEKEELFLLKSNGTQWTITNVNHEKILVGGNKLFYLWDATTQELLKAWSVPDVPYIQKIVVSPDGSLAAVTKGSVRDDVYIFKIDD